MPPSLGKLVGGIILCCNVSIIECAVLGKFVIRTSKENCGSLSALFTERLKVSPYSARQHKTFLWALTVWPAVVQLCKFFHRKAPRGISIPIKSTNRMWASVCITSPWCDPLVHRLPNSMAAFVHFCKLVMPWFHIWGLDLFLGKVYKILINNWKLNLSPYFVRSKFTHATRELNRP